MVDSTVFIHPQGIVEDGAVIGAGTRIWAWAHVLGNAKIGTECNLCDHVFIEGGAIIGDRVTIKCGVYIWDGITIEDDVFVGSSVSFTNDKFPRSRQWQKECCKTHIGKGASIGTNATLLPVTVGAFAMVGAGSVVTRDVPPYAIAVGNPARIVGYANTNKVASSPVSEELTSSQGASGAEIYSIPSFSDLRGDLSVLELEQLLPFAVKRIFYTYGVQSTEIRGEHAHKTCEQFLIAIHGSLHVIVDNGAIREEFVLNSPDRGLHLPAGCWSVQYKHSSDCVLLVLASHQYDAHDYIRDYDEFMRYKKGY